MLTRCAILQRDKRELKAPRRSWSITHKRVYLTNCVLCPLSYYTTQLLKKAHIGNCGVVNVAWDNGQIRHNSGRAAHSWPNLTYCRIGRAGGGPDKWSLIRKCEHLEATLKLAEAISLYGDTQSHQRGWKHKQAVCRCDEPRRATCRKCGAFCAHCGGLVIVVTADPDASQDASGGDAE